MTEQRGLKEQLMSQIRRSYNQNSATRHGNMSVNESVGRFTAGDVGGTRVHLPLVSFLGVSSNERPLYRLIGDAGDGHRL